MNRISKLLAICLVCLCPLFVTSCADPLKLKASADVLVSDIYRGLFQFQGEVGDFTIDVPGDVEGYLILSAPYAVVNVAEIEELENGALVNEEMISAIQDNSGYHLFILDDKKIITYQKWSSAPVAFNGFYYTRLEKNSTVTLKLGDKVLKSIAHIKNSDLVERRR